MEAEAGSNREYRKPESVNVNVNYCKIDHRRWEQRWRKRQEEIEKIKKPEPVTVYVNYCKMDHRRWQQRWKQSQEVTEKIKNLNLSMLMLIIAK